MHTNHLDQCSIRASSKMNGTSMSTSAASTRTSGISSTSVSSPLLGRPLSLGNLLIQRESTHSKTTSISSKRSFDILSPTASSSSASNTPVYSHSSAASGHLPGPSSSFNSVQYPLHSSANEGTGTGTASIASPTGSIHSIASTSSIPSVSTAIRTVLLPQNHHGVRTRVNIRAAPGNFKTSAAPGGGSSATLTKDHRVSSTLESARSPSPHLHHPRQVSGGAGPSGLGAPSSRIVDPPPRVQSAASASASTYQQPINKIMQVNTNNFTSSLHSKQPSASTVAPANAPRLFPDSSPRPDSPASFTAASADSLSTATEGYRFPAPRKDSNASHDQNKTFTYESPTQTTTLPTRMQPLKSTTSLTGSATLSTSEFGSLTAQASSSLSMNASESPRPPFATPPPASHPAYHRSHTADEVYQIGQSSAAPWEPTSSSTLARLQAPYASHSSKPMRTHLANLPKSLIPGGYDFSPASTSTHDSHHNHHQHHPQQSAYHSSTASAASAAAFAFARDRSASVPRTVSSYGDHENDSSRSSLDRSQQQLHHQHRPSVPDIDASFQTARQTLENGGNFSGRADESAHARMKSTSSLPSNGDTSSRQSIEEDNTASLAPLISPIPPKLDLDFGNSSGFSLDFGGDFSGSLGLSSIGGAGGLGLSLDNLGTSSSSGSSKVSLPNGADLRRATEQPLREKNDSTATTTMSSFLSMQDSTLSTNASDLSFLRLESAYDLAPLSSTSDDTVKPSAADPQPVQQALEAIDKEDDEDEPLQSFLHANLDKKASTSHTPTLSCSSHSISDRSATGLKSLNGPAEIVASAPLSTKSQSQPETAALRSESPASYISSNSLSRPVSSLFTSHAGAAGEGTARKRLLENPAYVGEYTASEDSKRTTLSSGEQLPIKTSSNSSSANLPRQGTHHNESVRASFNKSLPPVPPGGGVEGSPSTGNRSQARPGTGTSQSSSVEKPSMPIAIKSRSQLGLGMAPGPREQMSAGRRSYSEHSQSYNERRDSNASSTRRDVAGSLSGSDGDFKTPQFGAGTGSEGIKLASRAASETDTLSMHSNSTSGYTSLEVTRNFTAPAAPEATRVYRASADSEVIDRQGRSEQPRARASTLDKDAIRNPFDSNRSSKQDIPLATLARPKTNARNAWPNGELRKRDPITDKLLETVSAKLDVWLGRHPERVMTAEEAERHNRAPSPMVSETIPQPVTNSPKPLSRIPPPSIRMTDSKPPPPALSASLGSETSSLDLGFEVKNASAATSSVTKAIMINKIENGRPSAAQANLETSAHDASAAEPPKDEMCVPQRIEQQTELQTTKGQSSLPALTYSSSFPATTPSDSIASTSKTSEQPRTPLTAMASSPILDPSLATTVPLKIIPKTRSGTNVQKVRKPLSPGGEQPWGQTWLEITEALISYKSALKQQKQERAGFVQNGLLPHFRTEEHSALLRNRSLSNKQKDLLLDWVDALFEDLQGTPPNRGACLDGIAAVVESRLMSYFAFPQESEGFQRYERTIAMLAAFAVEKLNGKAIFANTLGFAGKMLAAAFWNLEGVGLKLLRLLPAVKKQHIVRIFADTGIAECPGNFPSHLSGLQFGGSPVDYIKLFRPVRPGTDGDTFLYKARFEIPSTKRSPVTASLGSPKEGASSGSQEVNIEMAGNWLIRWTATDSDLPFAFMRAYHRQLSNYLPLYQPDVIEPLTTAQLIRAPGYAFVSATLLEVCDALIHRNLRSVTTMAPSNTGVNANESANLAAGQKPKSLEIVSKRVIQTAFEVVGGALQAATPEASPVSYASAALRHNFGCSLSMWIRAVTKRTSMWDTRGIFALLDLIEGLMYNVCCPPYEEGVDEDDEVWIPSEVGLKLFDTKFILGFIRIILSKADNTTCLLRTISFLYTEFQSFTLRPEDREEVCDKIILDNEVFNRLFLYYNVGVRGYFLRLLVYRLARLGSSDDGEPASKDTSIFSTLRLFEYRLEKIRKRHDEIDPLDDWDSDSSDDFRPRPKRSTVCSTWGVRDKPWAMDLARIGSSDSSEDEGAKDGIERVRSNLQDILEDATEETTSQATERGHRRDPSQSSRKTSRKSSISSIKVSPLPSIPPIPTQHSSGVNTKKGVAKSAMKVWNALTNRKSPTGPSAKGKHGIHEAIAPFYEEGKLDQPRPVEVALTLENTASKRRRSSASSANRADPIKIVYGTPPKEKQSMTDKNPFPAQESKPSANAQTDDERDPASEASARTDVLSIEVPPPPRLRKRSSRKSIRKGASSHGATVNGRLAATAMSPRSRRSSMYSFDLDVETPRSDSFDLPRSPLLPSANGIVQSGSASPAAGSHAGVLSLSPVAFGALMDGALSFGLENDDPSADRSGDRLTPGGHRRHKSVSSARNRSRPVSVASDKTGPSPRVSKRFSKRASILPPPALDLLKESPSEPVPKIPEQYKSPTTCAGQSNNGGSTINSALRAPSPEPYAQRLHPYAVRGLREYEDCLDEWELFVHRVKEEEGVDGRELAALIPRLQCAWPSTWEE